jgi:hypothetical protein
LNLKNAQFCPAAVYLSCSQRGTNMRHITASLVIAACVGIMPMVGSAKGCLKGATVGGVVGHVAGHHAVLGAAAGCVIEHHREKTKEKATRQNAPSQNGAPGKDGAQFL